MKVGKYRRWECMPCGMCHKGTHCAYWTTIKLSSLFPESTLIIFSIDIYIYNPNRDILCTLMRCNLFNIKLLMMLLILLSDVIPFLNCMIVGSGSEVSTTKLNHTRIILLWRSMNNIIWCKTILFSLNSLTEKNALPNNQIVCIINSIVWVYGQEKTLDVDQMIMKTERNSNPSCFAYNVYDASFSIATSNIKNNIK